MTGKDNRNFKMPKKSNEQQPLFTVPEVSEVSVARGLYISLFTFFQPIRESLLENEGISLAEIFNVKIKTKNRL